jgi:hypothetical protein
MRQVRDFSGLSLSFGVQNRIFRPRPRWSHPHPSSIAGPRRFSAGLSGKSQFWGFLPQNEPFRHHCLPGHPRPRFTPDVPRASQRRSLPASLADRDPNSQHQCRALGTRPRKAALKEDRGHGVVRWSRTLCERPDTIRGAQRGPERQQGELEFWGLELRFSCSSALVLSRFELHCPVHCISC